MVGWQKVLTIQHYKPKSNSVFQPCLASCRVLRRNHGKSFWNKRFKQWRSYMFCDCIGSITTELLQKRSFISSTETYHVVTILSDSIFGTTLKIVNLKQHPRHSTAETATSSLINQTQQVKHLKKNKWATKKKPFYFPLYWLVNRDPYIGLL